MRGREGRKKVLVLSVGSAGRAFLEDVRSDGSLSVAVSEPVPCLVYPSDAGVDGGMSSVVGADGVDLTRSHVGIEE